MELYLHQQDCCRMISNGCPATGFCVDLYSMIGIILMALLLPTCPGNIQDQKFLPVAGIVNARDLGGYSTDEGKTVRSGCLFRSASLADAKDKDLTFFADIPVGTVVDFRMDFELRGKEDKAIPGARYVRLPVNSSGMDLTNEDAKELSRHKSFDVKKFIMIAAFNKRAQTIAREMYPTMVTDPACQRQFSAFLQMVVNADSAILFHCTQGKDRTGLAAAYLLSALGVDRDTVIKDFDATNAIYAKHVKRISRRIRFWGGKDEEIETVKAFIGANTENFIKALDLIDLRYGSMRDYLRGPLGLSENDIQRLKDRYLE